MFNWLYSFIGGMLSWFSNLFGGSYALALLLYALLFKLLFLPFSIKQQKNQIKMAQLTPKIELIKAKYRGRNDRPTQQKMQQEILELQQKEGYSPLSGCLPMLLQLPIIIFLYNVIRNPLSHICGWNQTISYNDKAVTVIDAVKSVIGDAAKGLEEIPLIGLINKQPSAVKETIEAIEGVDLSQIPRFTIFGNWLDLSGTPGEVWGWLVIIPIFAAALTWLSMFLSRIWNGNSNPMAQAQDAQTKTSMRIMDLVMPGMTLFFAFSFSGMMGLYWIYQSILGILQTFIISRVMPLPKYTEEELKAMRKAQKAAEKAQRAALKEAPKYRSLHYIDEDDYDELPEMKTDTKKKDTSGQLDAPEIKD